MAKSLEIEVKALVKRNEFYQILDFFDLDIKTSVTQINNYFDSKDFVLKHRNWSLRIREKGCDYILNLKELLDDLTIIEHEETLNYDEFRIMMITGALPEGEIKNRLQEVFPEKTFFKVTSLATERLSFPYKNGELFLDVNYYNTYFDFEIEYESDSLDYGIEVLSNLFEQIKIPFSRNFVPKVARAFNSSPYLV